jgi:hypothetical protein
VSAPGPDDARNGGDIAASVIASTVEATRLAQQSVDVVTLRLTGFAGLRPLAPGEAWRMLQEKPQAFATAALSAWYAAAGGQRPDQVFAAASRALSHETEANRRRLRAGPPAPGDAAPPLQDPA